MRARGGDLMPETIPPVGLLIVRSDPARLLTSTERSLVSIRLPSLSLMIKALRKSCFIGRKVQENCLFYTKKTLVVFSSRCKQQAKCKVIQILLTFLYLHNQQQAAVVSVKTLSLNKSSKNIPSIKCSFICFM